MAFDIEPWYERYAPMVHRRCQKLLGDEDRGTEAMHDVFADLAQQDGPHDLQGSARLLYRLATEVCLRHARRSAAADDDDMALDLELDIDDLSTAETASFHTTLFASLAQFPEPEPPTLLRRLVERFLPSAPVPAPLIATLHHIDEWTEQDIATDLGIPLASVQQSLKATKPYVAEHTAKVTEGKDSVLVAPDHAVGPGGVPHVAPDEATEADSQETATAGVGSPNLPSADLSSLEPASLADPEALEPSDLPDLEPAALPEPDDLMPTSLPSPDDDEPLVPTLLPGPESE